MAVEGARRRELAELMADHLLGDRHRHVLVAVVDAESEATNCGRTVERRLQILITSERPEPRATSAFFNM